MPSEEIPRDRSFMILETISVAGFTFFSMRTEEETYISLVSLIFLRVFSTASGSTSLVSSSDNKETASVRSSKVVE